MVKVLKGFDPQQFLAQHWQRAPLLLRGAWPGFRSPLDGHELAGLACEQDVESRLVEGRVETSFTLSHGPFDEDQFRQLPERDWTLLVQDVDKHVARVAALLEPFRFIPDWRIDDIMVSFAAPGGSVGPHTDQYDVFLLQASGRRRWQLSERFDPELRGDSDLKVLAHFEPEQDFVVEPGDLLYLPPNVAHYGLALDEAMTLSIGFRAPDQRELLLALADELLERADPSARFSDPSRELARDPARILAPDLQKLRQLVQSAALDEAALDRFIARYLTRPKPHLEAYGEPLSAAELAARLQAGDRLLRRLGSRWAYLEQGGVTILCVDGHEHAFAGTDEALLTRLLGGEPLGAEVCALSASAVTRLRALVAQGALAWASEGDPL